MTPKELVRKYAPMASFQESADGNSYYEPASLTIYIGEKYPFLTACHEIGHYLLRHSPRSFLKLSDNPESVWQEELDAWKVAKQIADIEEIAFDDEYVNAYCLGSYRRSLGVVCAPYWKDVNPQDIAVQFELPLYKAD